VDGNALCADCGNDNPLDLTWASSNLGVVLCNQCVGGHRNLGVHISKPLSLKMDDWSDDLKDGMLAAGNATLNAVHEEHPAAADFKPRPAADVEEKHAYVRSKYANKSFHAGGDGAMEPWKVRATSTIGTSGQVHAGIAIVRIFRGIDLVAADLNGKSDPYVKLKCGGKKAKTKVVNKSLNPEWDETLQLNVESQSEPITVEVVDVRALDALLDHQAACHAAAATAAAAAGDDYNRWAAIDAAME